MGTGYHRPIFKGRTGNLSLKNQNILILNQQQIHHGKHPFAI